MALALLFASALPLCLGAGDVEAQAGKQAATKPRLVVTPLEIKGMRIGTTKDEARSLIGYLDCMKTGDRVPDVDELCAHKILHPESPGATLAQHPVEQWSFYMKDGKTRRILVTLDADGGTAVAEAFRAKYGPPMSSQTKPMTNAFGAKVDQQRHTWASASELLSVQIHATKVGDALVTLGPIDTNTQQPKPDI